MNKKSLYENIIFKDDYKEMMTLKKEKIIIK